MQLALRTAFALATAASPALAGGPTDPSEWATLVYTRLTEVDLSGNGEPDVFREFDAEGRIRKLTMVSERAGQPPITHTVTWSADRASRVTEKKDRGRLVARTETAFSGLAWVRTLRLDHPDGRGKLTRRTTDEAAGGRIVRTEERLRGDRWIRASRVSLPSVYESILDSYAACTTGNWWTRNRCYYSASTTIPDFSHLLGVTCRSTDSVYLLGVSVGTTNVLRLASGYRVNLDSCSTTAAVSAIERATREIAPGMLSCLHRLNPDLAVSTYSAILESPEVRCGGDPPENPTSACASDTLSGSLCGDDANARTGVQDRTIMLLGLDPTVPGGGPHANLESTLFHETLHLAEAGISAEHSDDGAMWSGSDAVYGCELMCGSLGLRRYVSREHCESCASGGAVPESSCADLPPIEYRRVQAAGALAAACKADVAAMAGGGVAPQSCGYLFQTQYQPATLPSRVTLASCIRNAGTDPGCLDTIAAAAAARMAELRESSAGASWLSNTESDGFNVGPVTLSPR